MSIKIWEKFLNINIIFSNWTSFSCTQCCKHHVSTDPFRGVLGLIIDFNGMLTHLGLFYTKRQGNWMVDLYLHVLCSCSLRASYIQLYNIKYYLSNTNNWHTVVWFQVYLSNTNNFHTVVWFQVFLSNTNNFHTVVWFQVFLSNTNNLHIVVWFQVFHFKKLYGLKLFLFNNIHLFTQFQVTNNNS